MSDQKFLISSGAKEYSANISLLNDQLSGEINLMPNCSNERRTDILNEKRVQDLNIWNVAPYVYSHS